MKKIGIIILVAVLTLGVLGAAYAAWGQDLFINGTVSTGHYAVSFRSVTPPTTSNDTLAGLTAVKATTTVADDTVTITITNAFPNYSVTIPYVIQNTGTVPLGVAVSYVTLPPSWLIVDNIGAPANVAASDTASGTIILTCDGTTTPQSSGPVSFSYKFATTQSVP